MREPQVRSCPRKQRSACPETNQPSQEGPQAEDEHLGFAARASPGRPSGAHVTGVGFKNNKKVRAEGQEARGVADTS
ncbi:hypothetical protein Slala04_70110 [Streptomyces lavendulae subsp. lavendulae]|nr:hypothetical protein Slala04_70110 [Streptomyces lavendulae subsp. lavendulae]